MNERILKIYKIDDVFNSNGFNFKDDMNFKGFQIKTESQIIGFGIESVDKKEHHKAGCFLPKDHFEKFIGSSLFSLNITDTSRKTYLQDKDSEFVYSGGCEFIEFETSLGSLKFTALNEFSGKYGHFVKIASQKLN